MPEDFADPAEIRDCDSRRAAAWKRRASRTSGGSMRFHVAIAMWLVAALTGTAEWRQASAESYPSRRINLIVPFPAGSATDAVTRRLAESIRIETGMTVLVENKPGADGNLAALAVLKADADGY